MEWQQSRYYKNISLFIKLAIVVLAFGFIYKQVFYRHDREMLEQSLRAALNTASVTLILFAFVLMFLNWLIEAWKWKLLVERSEQISLAIAVKAVLAGVTIGAFTPNRFGEFAGRIFYLERTSRVDAILVTFAGSAAQLLVTIAAGSIALVSAYCFIVIPPGYEKTYWIVSILSAAGSILLVVVYLRARRYASFLGELSWLRRYRDNIRVLGMYSASDLGKVLLLSFLRYSVFTLQFYLLLVAFDVQPGAGAAIVLICITFLVITVIPTVALSELGVRGIAAVAVIGIAAHNEAGIVAASFSLWLINIAIPAITGSVFVFGLKFFKEKK